jgi:dTDP-4-dehydrorhamnose 3,5-epimerase
MIIKESKLPGVYEITPEPHVDERGFFMRTYDKKLLADRSIDREWVQENHSRSEKKGIIRGLHFQLPPYTETKMIRVIKGSIFDVFVDLRAGSPTFGKWGSAELSEENRKLLFIPRGFAHGFCTLTDVSEVVYKVDNYYRPDAECGIIWNDRELGIAWPAERPFLSKKDATLKSFRDFVGSYNGIKI